MLIPIFLDVGVNYEGICFVSMIIPVIISCVLLLLFKLKKINLILILTTIIFGFITFLVISKIVSDYLYYDVTNKIYFNLFYIELILLPILTFTIYIFKEQKEKKKLKIFSVFLIILLLIIFQILNSYYVKIDPNNVKYEYSISISSENESQGYVYIPFIRTNEYKESIFNNLQSKYPKSINSIVQTTYGTALNISFDTTFELHYEGKIDKDINLGMLDYNKSSRNEIIKIFMKLDKNDSLKIDFFWKLDGGGSGEMWKFEGEIKKDGWNSIEGRASGWSD